VIPSRSRIILRSLPVAAVLIVLALEANTADLTFVPGEANDLLVRKLGHASIYGLLAALLQWMFRAIDDPARARASARAWAWWYGSREWFLPLVLTTLVAIADEVIQGGTPGRGSHATDVLIDVTGAITFLVLLRSWRIRRSRAIGRPSAEPFAIEQASAPG
jgi:VanZ family protein